MDTSTTLCIRRDGLTASDNLSIKIVEPAKKISASNCQEWIRHSISFFGRCIAGESNI